MLDYKKLKTISLNDSKPVIDLTGLDIEKFGFKIDDFVCIEIVQNQIIISINDKTRQLTKLERLNPTLKKFITEFNLSI